MEPHVDLRIAELLASRLCHDLVSPIGAVNNGMELLEEDLDPETTGDAIRLASESARQASTVVQFYRMAYGRAGYEFDEDPERLVRLAEAFAAAHKASLAWQADAVAQSAAQGGRKLMLNMIALALEALPRGGAIEVQARPAESGLSLCTTAVGQGARLRAETLTAIGDDVEVDSLTPRSVHGYFTRRLARSLGGDLVVEDSGEDRIGLSVRVPGG